MLVVNYRNMKLSLNKGSCVQIPNIFEMNHPPGCANPVSIKISPSTPAKSGYTVTLQHRALNPHKKTRPSHRRIAHTYPSTPNLLSNN